QLFEGERHHLVPLRLDQCVELFLPADVAYLLDGESTDLYTPSLHDALPILTNLSTECLIQLTKLGYDATPFNQILKQNAKREMRLRLGKVTVADVLAAQPVTTNLLKFMRASIKMIGVSNLQSFIASM